MRKFNILIILTICIGCKSKSQTEIIETPKTCEVELLQHNDLVDADPKDNRKRVSADTTRILLKHSYLGRDPWEIERFAKDNDCALPFVQDENPSLTLYKEAFDAGVCFWCSTWNPNTKDWCTMPKTDVLSLWCS